MIPLGNTPAGAGKTRQSHPGCFFWKKHPRWRGEDNFPKRKRESGKETPPLARGRLLKVKTKNPFPGNTPAGAGKTRSKTSNGNSRKKHPRWRGEDPRRTGSRNRSTETPPLARGRRTNSTRSSGRTGNTPAGAGKTFELRHEVRDHRNTPAGAGKTTDDVLKALAPEKHPRWRGED